MAKLFIKFNLQYASNLDDKWAKKLKELEKNKKNKTTDFSPPAKTFTTTSLTTNRVNEINKPISIETEINQIENQSDIKLKEEVVPSNSSINAIGNSELDSLIKKAFEFLLDRDSDVLFVHKVSSKYTKL